MTKDDWPVEDDDDDDVFPDFCSDLLYIMSVDTAAMIVEAARHADQVRRLIGNYCKPVLLSLKKP